MGANELVDLTDAAKTASHNIVYFQDRSEEKCASHR